MAGVLSGLKVLDLSKGIAGPMATMMLGGSWRVRDQRSTHRG